MKRHSLSTRIWHWVNFASLTILFMSGLNISNAHPRLYWGDWGFEAQDAWLHLPRYPGWATIPNYYSLAAARDWHLLFAWVFVIGLLLYILAAIINGHFRRDILTSRKEWRWATVREDFAAHLRRDFRRPGSKYNFFQKLSYGLVIFVMLPVMILTGLSLSPAMAAAWPWLLDLFGGRQSARSIHFIVAWGLFVFLVVHVLLVLLSGPARQLKDMIVGGRIDEPA